MKKSVLLSLMISLFMGVMNVNAMTESDLKARLKDPVAVGDKVIAISNDKKVLIDKYFNEHDLDKDEINYIYNAVENARNILKNQSANSIDNLSTNTKNELKKIVNGINANTSVNASIEKGNLVIYNDDHTVFATITEPVKQTAMDSSSVFTIILTSLTAITAGASIIIRKMNANK